ncbi:hypothetical protein [Nocardia xishanensis]|uniref:Prolyl oligopeptidase family protein n=1 Tax=Nocardia xishanensis TaxID=238964 RepID=A0ABW7XAG3_9NOCA
MRHRPLFIGHGLTDIDVPAPTTLAFAEALTAGRQPVALKVYDTDHSGAFAESLPDVLPFVNSLF